MVQKGSGDHWQVDILNRRRGNKWDKVGDLSRSGSDWTTSNLVVRSDEKFNCRATANEGSQPKRCIDDYFGNRNEVMVRIHTRRSKEVRAPVLPMSAYRGKLQTSVALCSVVYVCRSLEFRPDSPKAPHPSPTAHSRVSWLRRSAAFTTRLASLPPAGTVPRNKFPLPS